MFETSSVRRSKRTFHPLTLVTSAVLHLIAIGAVVFATVWHVEHPENEPKQMSMLRFDAAPPLPPKAPVRKGDPEASREARPEAAKEVPAEPIQESVPQAVPDSIPDLGEDRDDDLSEPGQFGHPDGEVDGEEDGAPDGIAGGVGGGESGAALVDQRTYTPGNGVSAPVIIHRVEPVYPALLRQMGKSGVARIECVISPGGQLTNIRVIHATHPLFAEAALAAVQQWKFLPGRLDGRAVSTRFDFTVNFSVSR